MTDYSSAFRDDPPVPADPFSAPAVAPAVTEQVAAPLEAAPVATGTAPPVVAEGEYRAGPVAILAGAVVALVGGLLWAGVVIETHYDIGILAWLVGAATGTAVVRVAGGPVGVAPRIVAGAFAAVGIMVGKYVIFVHEVRSAFATLLAAQGFTIGYLDTRQMSIFLHNVGSLVKPIYALWVALAFVAAVRVAGGRGLFSRR